jgi:putative phage-type endonuclease
LYAPNRYILINDKQENSIIMILNQARKVNAIRHDVDQGSPEWLALRKKHVCASDALEVMSLSKWTTRQEALDRKLGILAEKQKNYLMERGVELEPPARRLAEEMLDTFFIPGVYQSIEYPFMLASLDGICMDNKLILEVKCTNKKNHELAKDGKIPDYYYPQVQHQIAVCDIDCCHYFSFDGDSGVIVIVDRDEEFIKRMIEIEYEFYQEMIK